MTFGYFVTTLHISCTIVVVEFVNTARVVVVVFVIALLAVAQVETIRVAV